MCSNPVACQRRSLLIYKRAARTKCTSKPLSASAFISAGDGQRARIIKQGEKINKNKFFAKLMSCCLFDQLLPTGCVPEPVRWRKHHWVRLLCVRCVRRPVCSVCLRKHGGGTRPQLSWSLGCQLPRGDSFNLGAGGAAQNGNSPLSLPLST